MQTSGSDDASVAMEHAPRKKGLWGRLRLSVRLAILIFGAELLLLTAFASTTYFFTERQFHRSFDTALRAQSEALVSMVEEPKGREDSLTAKHFAEVARYVSEKGKRDLFAVLGPQGEVVWKSKRLTYLPELAKNRGSKTIYTRFRYEGKHYRGVYLPCSEASKASPWLREHGFSVFLASRSRKMDADLADIAQFLVFSVSCLLVVSGPLAGYIAWRGLAPVRRLAHQTDKIEETNLHLRLAVRSIPPDLAPLARATNALLERLELAFERQKQFSADAAHELRTPVAILKSGVQAALLSERNGEEDQAALEDLLDEVSRLEDLCESLLLITSAPETRETASMTFSDWIDCAEGAVDDLTSLAEENGCSARLVEPAVRPEGMVLQTDERATRRIVTNLVQNAVRHAACGQVEVIVSLDEGSPALIVEDDGIGVPEGDEEKLFDRFFRANSARSRGNGGTGLGLAICRALAEASGGSISYERRSPKGSRFLWRVQTLEAE